MERITARPERRGGLFTLWLGGVLLILGVLTMIAGSVWIGLVVAVVGLVTLGVFARANLR
jgi:hypothetical protein